jgi:hypothetical protein
MLTKRQAEHPVALVSGVRATDSKVEAAEKALATMKLAGFSPRAIKKAEALVATIRAQEASR